MSKVRSMKHGPIRLAAVVLVASLAACGETPAEVEFEVIEEVTFASSLNIDLAQMTETNNGIYWMDEVVGTGGQLEFGHWATIDYTGWLANGTMFDMGTDLSYLMGNINVVRGLEDGSLGMRVGGTRLIIIPPHLGYGGQGNGPVPPGAIMVFRATLTRASENPPS